MAYGMTHGMSCIILHPPTGLRHVSGRATVVGVEQTLELFPRGKRAIFCYETMAGDVLKSDEIGINVCLSWMDSSDHQSMYINIPIHIYIYVCVFVVVRAWLFRSCYDCR
jgi:hypothetical protein